ncbi:MAG: RecX family transcriptional regulator [Treponema sp.]|nr:RecX family transcriptional regulator [Treponema sp.]
MARVEELEALGLGPLGPGSELDEEAQALLALAAETYEAERRALALLARAEQSAFMLRSKLMARGFDARSIRSALSRLGSLGLLDDRRFATAYASSRLARRSEGPASLRAALQAHGIDGELAREVVGSLFSGEARAELLARAFGRELRRSGGDAAAARDRLRRLGYSAGEVADCG